jgi:hypothetical protein
MEEFHGETISSVKGENYFYKARTPSRWLEHFKNMEEFYGETISSSKDENYFYTRYTLGLSGKEYKPGDVVFAVDGVPFPLLLRQVQPNRYRIVGGCAIIFGDHLRICNAPQVSAPYHRFMMTPRGQCNQTRIIEVY